MIDPFDASHDRLRLATARALSSYDEGQLFECLSDPEPILRTAAARQLHLRGGRAVFDQAAGMLEHPRFDCREIGIFVLGQLGTPHCPYAPDTFERLPRLLEDPYAEVRSAAVGAIGSLASLGHQPPRHILDAVLRLSADESPDVRASVAFALGMVDDPSVVSRLGMMGADNDPDVRDMAETAVDWFFDRLSTKTPPQEVSGPTPSERRKARRRAQTSHG